MRDDDPRWDELSSAMAAERDDASFMSLLLDQELIRRATEKDAPRVLDFGAGTGVLALSVAAGGAAVDALEPAPSQHALLLETIADNQRSRIRALAHESEVAGPYDLVLCINVLDHVEDYVGTIGRLVSWIRPGGRLLCVVPHPLKDLGEWHRFPLDGGASSYRHYVLRDYLTEGECLKNREDSVGRVIARNIPSHHRTISSYFNALILNGLVVQEMLEPGPDPADAAAQPVLFAKSSRIPYFLLFDCQRPESQR